MITVLHEFHNDKGDAYLLSNSRGGYSVSHIEIKAAGVYRHKITGCLRHAIALEQYRARVAALKGLAPEAVSYKCKFGCGAGFCRSDNCPAELGGAAFWEIFGNSCLYKQR